MSTTPEVPLKCDWCGHPLPAVPEGPAFEGEVAFRLSRWGGPFPFRACGEGCFNAARQYLEFCSRWWVMYCVLVTLFVAAVVIVLLAVKPPLNVRWAGIAVFLLGVTQLVLPFGRTYRRKSGNLLITFRSLLWARAGGVLLIAVGALSVLNLVR